MRRIPGVPDALQRVIIKKLVLTALNAKTRNAAFASFSEGFPKGHLAKRLSDKVLETLLFRFIEKHPHLEWAICTDQGIGLMNLDAQIAELVLRHFPNLGIPVLSVHDSFIIDYRKVAMLKDVMAKASRQVAGQALPVEDNGPGLDEWDFPEVLLDFEAWRETERVSGYLQRMRNWEERKGKLIKHIRGGR